jgi:hypothetical protein
MRAQIVVIATRGCYSRCREAEPIVSDGAIVHAKLRATRQILEDCRTDASGKCG